MYFSIPHIIILLTIYMSNTENTEINCRLVWVLPHIMYPLTPKQKQPFQTVVLLEVANMSSDLPAKKTKQANV